MLNTDYICHMYVVHVYVWHMYISSTYNVILDLIWTSISKFFRSSTSACITAHSIRSWRWKRRFFILFLCPKMGMTWRSQINELGNLIKFALASFYILVADVRPSHVCTFRVCNVPQRAYVSAFTPQRFQGIALIRFSSLSPAFPLYLIYMFSSLTL